MSIEEKATLFFTNYMLEYLKEVYGESCTGADIEFNDDLTAMLIAMKVFTQQTADWDGDVVDFTHVLNKLAIQYAFSDKSEAFE